MRPSLSAGIGDQRTPVLAGPTSNVRAGTILYKVLWEGYPEEIATGEEADNNLHEPR